ncbi:MAG: hypothetical protein NTX05_06450 [Fusobacteria bacterium]|nr:hypothetical protein [Fusobacteriota bacterium]
MKKRGSILLESIIAILILLMVMLSLLAIYDSVFKAQTENVYRTKGIEVAQTISNLVQQKGYTFLNTKAGSSGFQKVYKINNDWTIGDNFTQDFELGNNVNDMVKIKNLGISPLKLSVKIILNKVTPTLADGTAIYSNDQASQNFISGKVMVNWSLKGNSSKSAVVDFVIPEIRETTKLDTTT